MNVSPLVLSVLLALALVALLVALRLFLLRPPDRPYDYRAAFGIDPRSALRELLDGPAAAAARAAELRGDWAEARAAYARALEDVRGQDAADPKVGLQRRALESKLEELDRLHARGG